MGLSFVKHRIGETSVDLYSSHIKRNKIRNGHQVFRGGNQGESMEGEKEKE